MFDAFAITLRELAELILIVGSLHVCLRESRRFSLIKYVGWGLGLGLAPAAALSVLLMDASVDRNVSAGLSTLMAVGILVMATSMAASVRQIRGRVHLFHEAWLDSQAAPFLVVAFVALSAFRESLEIAVFVRAIGARSGMADAAAGVLLGVAATGLLLPAWQWLHLRARLLLAFRVSALLLALLAIQLLLYSVADLLRIPELRDDGVAWALTVAPFFEEGARHAWLCAVLMLPPLYWVLRGWWSETAARAE